MNEPPGPNMKDGFFIADENILFAELKFAPELSSVLPNLDSWRSSIIG
jgi:hypothetical protein